MAVSHANAVIHAFHKAAAAVCSKPDYYTAFITSGRSATTLVHSQLFCGPSIPASVQGILIKLTECRQSLTIELLAHEQANDSRPVQFKSQRRARRTPTA